MTMGEVILGVFIYNFEHVFPCGKFNCAENEKTSRTQGKPIHTRCSKKENSETFTQDRIKGRSLFLTNDRKYLTLALRLLSI